MDRDDDIYTEPREGEIKLPSEQLGASLSGLLGLKSNESVTAVRPLAYEVEITQRFEGHSTTFCRQVTISG
jgi:hypothetical protein